MEKVERKLMVCAEKGCTTCKSELRVVPEECGYFLCHVMDTSHNGIRLAARQSGKTTKIVRSAAKLASMGHRVVVLVPTTMMAEDLRRMMMGSGVKVLSTKRSRRGEVPDCLRGLEESVVLSDEVPEHVEELVELAGHQFVMGFRS